MSKPLYIYLGDNAEAPYEFKADTGVVGTINPAIFGYLLNANERQELSPGLAKRWNYDFKTQTFEIELGSAKFHNNREVTAEDVEFSIVRGFISNAVNYNRIHFSDILGIEKLKIGTEYRPGLVEGIKTTGSKIIKITLARKNPLFLLAFTIPFSTIVPKEELQGDYFTWKRFPIGAGPYKVEKPYKDFEVILSLAESTANEIASDFQRPNKIVYHNRRTPGLSYDVILDRATLTEVEKKYTFQLSKYPVMISTLFFYRGNPIGENVNYRKAIYHAIDREALAKTDDIFKPAFEMMVRPYGGRINPKNPYDPKLAKEYAKKIPKALLKTPVKIGIYTTVPEWGPATLKRNELIARYLKEVGIGVEFGVNREKFPTPAVMKTFDIKQAAKVVDLADPSISFGAMASISPYSVEVPSNDGRFDKLYEASVNAAGFDDRIKAIEKLAILIQEEALMVPLLQKFVAYHVNPETIESLGDQPKPLFLNTALIRMKNKAVASN